MQLLGVISDSEKNTIIQLQRRKGALEDLFLTLNRSSEYTTALYERIVSDMEQVKEEMDNWWGTTASNHSFSYTSTDRWSLDFKTNEIWLEHATV